MIVRRDSINIASRKTQKVEQETQIDFQMKVNHIEWFEQKGIYRNLQMVSAEGSDISGVQIKLELDKGEEIQIQDVSTKEFYSQCEFALDLVDISVFNQPGYYNILVQQSIVEVCIPQIIIQNKDANCQQQFELLTQNIQFTEILGYLPVKGLSQELSFNFNGIKPKLTLVNQDEYVIPPVLIEYIENSCQFTQDRQIDSQSIFDMSGIIRMMQQDNCQSIEVNPINLILDSVSFECVNIGEIEKNETFTQCSFQIGIENIESFNHHGYCARLNNELFDSITISSIIIECKDIACQQQYDIQAQNIKPIEITGYLPSKGLSQNLGLSIEGIRPQLIVADEIEEAIPPIFVEFKDNQTQFQKQWQVESEEVYSKEGIIRMMQKSNCQSLKVDPVYSQLQIVALECLQIDEMQKKVSFTQCDFDIDYSKIDAIDILGYVRSFEMAFISQVQIDPILINQENASTQSNTDLQIEYYNWFNSPGLIKDMKIQNHMMTFIEPYTVPLQIQQSDLIVIEDILKIQLEDKITQFSNRPELSITMGSEHILHGKQCHLQLSNAHYIQLFPIEKIMNKLQVESIDIQPIITSCQSTLTECFNQIYQESAEPLKILPYIPNKVIENITQSSLYIEFTPKSLKQIQFDPQTQILISSLTQAKELTCQHQNTLELQINPIKRIIQIAKCYNTNISNLSKCGTQLNIQNFDQISLQIQRASLNTSQSNSLQISKPQLNLNFSHEISMAILYSDPIEWIAPEQDFDLKSNMSGFTRRTNFGVSNDTIELFFTLIAQAAKLNSPQKEKIGIIPTVKLYNKVLDLQLPFNEWHDWIQNKLHDKLTKKQRKQ